MYWGLIVVFIVLAFWLHNRYSSSSEDYPALETDPNDPLLLQAVADAKASLEEFKSLYRQFPKDAFVKLDFESDCGVSEHLGAHVEGIKGDEISVFLVTPPVTHQGKLAHNYTCHFDDIEDWQITDKEGNIYGGFTQRAMFAIAEREGVELPRELQEMQGKYV
ncbi:DUF2314 domain-containing protein [Pseudoalteromonas rubra]|uniref:DUF2314 domain-containing protein n=1 Tax=Pseudoalteromonas rubra TaxID=43658 RepID=A0A0U3IQX5_9GAMM|nr:DUF2314 domain-containing protein [Pseudoalteromonas rubra]ALU45724.1 hypothetical protein AT705_22585 [Pseudoalteromonas rubra]